MGNAVSRGHGWRGVACSALAAVLTACGGGGGSGGDSASPSRPPLARVVQDIAPPGPRIDVAADDFFVASTADKAIYRSRTVGPLGVDVDVHRDVVFGPDAQGRFTVVESVPGQLVVAPVTERWQRRADGLVALDFMGDGAPPGFRAIVGDTLLFPTPFHPVGSVRTIVRQGSLDKDLDGDGFTESFRLELTQTFVGFETATRAGRAERRARFRHRTVMVVQSSRLGVPDVRSEADETLTFAAHTGLISAQRQGVLAEASLVQHEGPVLLVGGVLAGRPADTAWNGGTVRLVVLEHLDLVFDPAGGHYYAGVGLGDAAHPGTVARIDPATGVAAFSEPLGADVPSVAVSADGRSLYAALRDRAEIVRLSLPDLQVRQRIALPVGTWAFSLAVSPADADVLAYHGDSFAGLRLIRQGVLQPRAPNPADLRAESIDNPAMFSPDGAQLFMYGSHGSVGPRLLAVPVLADGFGDSVRAASAISIGRSLSLSGGDLVSGTALHRASDLAVLRAAADGQAIHSCSALPGAHRWVCLSERERSRVGVLDATTLSLIEDGLVPLPGAPVPFGAVVRVVPGPRGQVAMMLSSGAAGQGRAVALFDNPDFR
ncbi:hypothetical protein [Ideonella sp. A 288]|uniref:hypothetical protein n=1 Tax=Ideonella sp. A 288 TaxID=1962181 RepID=UPI000B4A8EF9|nr:hypothetical protein [Ideonella sp. A 288]